MSNFVVELPPDLQSQIARRAGNVPGAESAWVAEAVREKLAACDQMDYLQSRALRGNREAFERVLAKIPAAQPLPGDERDETGRTKG
jgi:hypothetical protein